MSLLFQGKIARIQKNERFIQTPPNRYGSSSCLSNYSRSVGCRFWGVVGSWLGNAWKCLGILRQINRPRQDMQMIGFIVLGFTCGLTSALPRNLPFPLKADFVLTNDLFATKMPFVRPCWVLSKDEIGPY